MYKLLATIERELRLLTRDRAGLALLFVMPAVLVLVITLVQDNVLEAHTNTRIKGLLVDQDGGTAAQALISHLDRADIISIVKTTDAQPVKEAWALKAVGRGDYQFCIVLPPAMSTGVQKRVRLDIDGLLAGTAAGAPSEALAKALGPHVKILFDPTIRGGYRAAVRGALHQAAASMQTAFRIKYLGEALNRRLQETISELAGPYGPVVQNPVLPDFEFDLFETSLVRISEHTAGPNKYARLPSAVQQNVPAWALFGMFFIVVPLSGALIRERKEGIFDRLLTMPVSRMTLIAGKLVAYLCVCLVQFVFIAMVGKWILPLLGTGVLEMGPNFLAVGLVAVCSALGATGYGVMLGALARTHEQATTLGPVSVVIAAALGGIMVPVFAMPPMMQTISQWSPLAWAHGAFMELLVRGGTLSAVKGHLVLLLSFSALTLLVGLIAMQRRH